MEDVIVCEYCNKSNCCPIPHLKGLPGGCHEFSGSSYLCAGCGKRIDNDADDSHREQCDRLTMRPQIANPDLVVSKSRSDDNYNKLLL